MLNAFKLLVFQPLGFSSLFALALFISAGHVAWAAGWVFLGLFFSCFLAINLWLWRHNPGLLRERQNLSHANQQGWDKVLFPLFLVATVGWLVFTTLDATRWHWSPLPLWLQAVGAGVLLLAFYILFLAFRENAYLATVVRLQTERGHQVITTGPYRYVRHPMYAGMIVFMAGTSLLLGAGYGLLAGLLMVLVLAGRAVLEERLLHQVLPGYTAYTTQVKYRFIPYIW